MPSPKQSGDDGSWRQFGVAVPVMGAVVGIAFFANRPAHCTVQEGLCTTTPCSCGDPALQLRELRTPEGKECWQCVATCPAQIDGNASDECYAGNCECADPTQERVLADASTADAPCHKCVTPPPVVVLRAGLEPSKPCLVRAPRSKLPPPAVRATGPGAEPVLRLVLTEEGPELNASCASFIREGGSLRERNTSLCLSWSVSGSLWGLGKCALPEAPEAQLQTFHELSNYSADGKTTMGFCTSTDREWPAEDEAPVSHGTPDLLDESSSCVSLIGHICASEAGVCTPRPCECEDPTWVRHEAPLPDSAGPCWACSPPLVAFCSTQPGVCTTTPCECEDPSHEKILSNTTEPPVRTCWSCAPAGSSGGSSTAGGGAAGILVGVFLCGLLGGLALRRWGEDTSPALFAQKGKRGSKAAAALRPLPWSERLALELEEVWATVEDAAGLVGQAWGAAAKPLRRWRKQAAGAAAPYVKGCSEKASDVASRVSGVASGISSRLSGVASMLVPASPASSATGPPAGQHKPRKTQPNKREVPSAETQPEQAESSATATPTTASTAASPQASPAEVKAEEASTKRRRPRKKASNEVLAAQESGTAAAAAEAEVEAEVRDVQPAEDIVAATEPEVAATDRGCSQEDVKSSDEVVAEQDAAGDLPVGERWDPVQASSSSRRGASDLQHARLLMLLSNTRHSGLKVDKRSLAANWLLLYHVNPGRRNAESIDVGQKGPTSTAQTAGRWDPLSTPAPQPRGERGCSLQHARLLLLLVGNEQSGTPYSARTLAATWLMLFYMPESSRTMPALQALHAQEEVPEAQEPVASPSNSKQRHRGGRQRQRARHHQ